MSEVETKKTCFADIELTKRKYLLPNDTGSTRTTTATIITTSTVTTATIAKATTINFTATTTATATKTTSLQAKFWEILTLYGPNRGRLEDS